MAALLSQIIFLTDKPVKMLCDITSRTPIFWKQGGARSRTPRFYVAGLMLLASALFGATLGKEMRTLRMGITSLPPAYGNPYGAIGLPGALTWQQIYDGLTKLNEKGEIVGALATEWEMLDPLTWRFKLRENARYSNGKVFDAYKAQAVFHWLQSDAGRITIVGNEIKGIDKVSVTGPYDLLIHTLRPDPILPQRLSIVMMVEPDVWLANGVQAYARAPVGTGSYVVDTWQNKNGAAKLVANPYSWRPPYIQNVEIFPLNDHAARFQAAISKQLHLAQSLRPEEIEIFQKRGFDVRVDATKQIIGLAFDVEGHSDSPIGDKRVRQALNYAIDKNTISEIITYGAHPPAGQGAAPGVFGYNEAVSPYPYDPGKARALLREAGYPDGFSMSATVVIGTYANDVEIYQKVQQDLAAIGVAMTIHSTVFSDWIQQYVTGKWRSEAFSLAWNATPYNDSIRPMEYYSCKKSRPFFCKDSMMVDLNNAASELDPLKREQILFDLQSQFHDEAPQLFLLEYGHIWVSSQEVSGFSLHDRVPPLHKIRFRETK